MRIVTRLEDVGQLDGPTCVLVDAGELDDPRLRDALGDLAPAARLVSAAADGKRPFARIEGETGDDLRVELLVLLADGLEGRRRVLLHLAGDLLLVAGDETARTAVRAGLTAYDAGPGEGLAVALSVLARQAEEHLEQVADSEITVDMDTAGDRLLTSTARRETNRQRAMLFEWRQLYATQSHLADHDQLLAEVLGGEARRLLRISHASFRYSSDTAARLYALLGDLLSQQDALTSQRLTLITTVFLPLTVTTGFFGMNFGWMVGQIGSLWSFLVLGVLVPALAVVVSTTAVRRYSG